jgi:hypothetical protein
MAGRHVPRARSDHDVVGGECGVEIGIRRPSRLPGVRGPPLRPGAAPAVTERRALHERNSRAGHLRGRQDIARSAACARAPGGTMVCINIQGALAIVPWWPTMHGTQTK